MEFDPVSTIPADIRNEIEKTEVGRTHEADATAEYLKDIADEIAENSVLEPLRSNGYFRAFADAKLTVLKTDGPSVDVAATVVAQSGERFRIGDIRFKNRDADQAISYAVEVLRDSIPLKQGETLDVRKIREGFANLARLYGRDGYIDMTAEPEFHIDEQKGVIDMTVVLDLGKQYRIRAIEFRGAEPSLDRRLRESLQHSGEVLDTTRLEQFLKENGSLFSPTDKSYEIHRDPYAGTIDLVFDLQTCSAS